MRKTIVLALAAAAVAAPAVAHGHNLFAVGLWWAWASRRGRAHWPALALFALGLFLAAFGIVDEIVWRVGAYVAPRAGVDLGALVRELSPTRDPILSLRLVFAFAFAQSVHYSVWLRLIPEDDRPRPGVRSFASSWRALTADVGCPLALATCATVLVLVAWAMLEVSAARSAYLRVAGFHAYLECAVTALLALEGRLPLRRGPC